MATGTRKDSLSVIFFVSHTFGNIGLRSAQNLVKGPCPKIPAHPGLWQLFLLTQTHAPTTHEDQPPLCILNQVFLSPSGNVYKFQTGSRFHAILWHKHLDDACKSNRPQVTSPRSCFSPETLKVQKPVSKKKKTKTKTKRKENATDIPSRGQCGAKCDTI